jgi:hypothetical protein
VQQKALQRLRGSKKPEGLNKIIDLGDDWYMLLREHEAYFIFAPPKGIEAAEAERMVMAHRQTRDIETELRYSYRLGQTPTKRVPEPILKRWYP